MPLGEQGQVVVREDPADSLLGELVSKLRHEEVRDGEAAIARERPLKPRVVQDVGPERARDVGQDAGAIALAIDDAAAVRELVEAP